MRIKCAKCGEVKTSSLFSRVQYPKAKTARQRFNGWCKSCRANDSRRYIKAKGYTRSLDPLTRRLQYLTAHLNHTGSTVRTKYLRELYAKQNGLCAYTGIRMSFGERGKPPSGYQMSIDRVDSAKGYSADNLVLCCLAINHLKARHSIKEMYNMLFAFAEGAKLCHHKY